MLSIKTFFQKAKALGNRKGADIWPHYRPEDLHGYLPQFPGKRWWEKYMPSNGIHTPPKHHL